MRKKIDYIDKIKLICVECLEELPCNCECQKTRDEVGYPTQSKTLKKEKMEFILMRQERFKMQKRRMELMEKAVQITQKMLEKIERILLMRQERFKMQKRRMELMEKAVKIEEDRNKLLEKCWKKLNEPLFRQNTD